MATEVILPRLGQGMESGTIVRWLKSEGEPVEKGEPLFELDTDKVTQEVEAEAAGVLLKIAVAEGEVPVGQTVAFIGAEGEDVARGRGRRAEAEEAPRSARPEPAAARRAQEAPSSRPRRSRPANGRIKASPLARRIARERGIELSRDPRHRPRRPDRRRGRRARGGRRPSRAAPVAPLRPRRGEVERIPLSNVRKTIARRLTEAWQIPSSSSRPRPT